MYETGKAAQVATEMRNYKLEVLGLCETRWTQSGQQRLTTGELILYSGHEAEDAHHTEGVAFMLSKEAQSALIGWEAVSSRLITASFNTQLKKRKLNFILSYAPTNDSDEETKSRFYSELHGLLEHWKENDINIPKGDFNAKIGSDNTGYEVVIGKHGLGEMNGNDETLVETCALFDLVMGGVFSRIRKYTRQHRFRLTMLQQTKLIIYVYARNSEDLSWTLKLKEVQMWLQITTLSQQNLN
jgi:hypothetical protein